MADERCDGCRFWRPRGGDEGRCARFPPRLSEYALQFYTENPDPDEPPDAYEEQTMLHAVRGLDVWFQPVTHADDGCGEWKPPG